MVCAEDIVSYFQSLKSYERIWIMCRLQHSCLPFELRFLGTCLEELGRKDFTELRQAENEANSPAEISSGELSKISNKNVQKKIILYLSLLYSYNYSCSNSLFKILCNIDEVCSILKYDTCLDDEDESFEHLLMIYTLAVNHPAFSCEQKQVLHDIFSFVQAEENKRTGAKGKSQQANIESSENAAFNDKSSVQECPAAISTSPENTYPAHPLPNPSHCYSSVPPPYASDIPIPLAEQISLVPGTNFVRYPFAATTSPQLIPNAWSTAVPIVFTTTEHTNTTHTFMSRSSSPSISNTPSRSSSPSAKGRPLSAPFSRSPQISGNVSQQPASLPLPQTNDPFIDCKESPNLRINPVPNITPEQLYRLSDEGLAALGMTEESIQQLRCLADKMQTNTDDLSPTNSTTNKTMQYIDPETDDLKAFIEQSVPATGLVYTAAMAVATPPGAAVACAVGNPCQYCLINPNGAVAGGAATAAANQMNGFVSPATVAVPAACGLAVNPVPNATGPVPVASTPLAGPADMRPCIDQMRMLRLESGGGTGSGGAASGNSNSSNSDTTSSDQSPPQTPMLPQANFAKSKKGARERRAQREAGGGIGGVASSDEAKPNLIPVLTGVGSTKSSNSEWSNSNVNSNSDERGNAGDSSSEERTNNQSASYHGRGRVMNNRGRSKNANSFTRGRGNNRRGAENVNGNTEDPRKSQPQQYTNTEATTYQFTTHPATATVTNTTYIQPSHFIRSFPTFPAGPNSFLRYPGFPPNTDVLYHHYPPPTAAFLPHGAITYPAVVPPKLSCYNCGSQNHFADACVESTMEEAAKQGQYRLDYAPVEAPNSFEK